ncbi:hypothetical protein NKR23_g6937 [Pleurostoma richardsiae]|uniref:Uncharacterized protein n=1 Tax=Pleurostoma richardsiae TaxID=41990 RepID=A0AA38VNC6_9PEZI|nr:hypothetical protein NKR23_g6937 [Pleurostoma richardsiae]
MATNNESPGPQPIPTKKPGQLPAKENADPPIIITAKRRWPHHLRLLLRPGLPPSTTFNQFFLLGGVRQGRGGGEVVELAQGQPEGWAGGGVGVWRW